eukprot:CAMPEP_0181467966 /NCGR_PEP_ID=MMETSP1110-20121109/37252_1 /TAXON_ID=174948 /ORGANISM="Symbiodinium sp., Strain CCMP421" /LENGTH=486 /DNA_ID=CAMNT_0023592811 /DNA_START=64 /DNA_END=1521 /DNA_ORIENTATION=-
MLRLLLVLLACVKGRRFESSQRDTGNRAIQVSFNHSAVVLRDDDGWDPGWVQVNSQEVLPTHEDWERWPEWDEAEREHPAMKGLKDDKVNYKGAADGLEKIANRIANYTRKFECSKQQKKIIDTVGLCTQALTDMLMEVSPVFGPAAPFVFAGAMGINIAAGIMMSVTGVKELKFTYDLSNLDHKVRQHFDQMGWDFQLMMLSLKKVQETIDSLAHRMSRMLNNILAKLTEMRRQAISLKLQPSMSDMNIIAIIHQDFLRAISTNADIVQTLEPNIQQLVDIEVRMRANFESNLNELTECEACGGRAAAALWLVKALDARVQVWSILLVFRMLTNNMARAELVSQHFLLDVDSWPKIWGKAGLAPWLRLRGRELSKYLIPAEEYVALEGKIEDLRSGSSDRQLSAAKDLTHWRPEAAAHVVDHLLPFLNPPPMAFDFDIFVALPALCETAAVIVGRVGYPAAWQATEALEKTRLGLVPPNSPCAKQ